MNIMVITDTNYYKYLLVLMTSLFVNHKDEKFNFYIVFNELSETAKTELSKYALEHGGNCSFLKSSSQMFEGLKILNRYPSEIYWKLIPHMIIPEEVDRILYLDVDMIVDGDLKEVYNKVFPDQCYFFACRGINAFKKYYLQDERNTVDSNYVNSGFLLSNLKELREKKITLDTYKSFLDNNEQTLLEEELLNNTLVHGEIQYLYPFDYNYNAGADEYYREYSQANHITMKKAVRHYLGYGNRKFGKFFKPWDIIFPNKQPKEKEDSRDIFENNIMVWWKYAELSPYYQEFFQHAISNITEYYETRIHSFENKIFGYKKITGMAIEDTDGNLNCYAKWSNGELLYFENNKNNRSFTGLALTLDGSIVYFENGVFQKTFSGAIINKSGDELLIKNGIHRSFTGVYRINSELIYFENGIRSHTYTGIATTEQGTPVMITNGSHDKNFNGLINDSSGMIIFVRKGIFDKDFSGIYKGRRIEKGVLVDC